MKTDGAAFRICPVANRICNGTRFLFRSALDKLSIVIGILVVTWLILHAIFQLPASSVFVTGTLLALFFQPVIMRLGRAIWINLFVPYRGRQG